MDAEQKPETKTRRKRILAVHDLSCVGKCSLTVAIPIVSAAGIETVPLPTALLSTQTSGIPDHTFTDMTDQIPPILAHWKSLGLGFDGIYSGYLGSPEQIDILCGIIDGIGNDAQVFVDPVMGDDGSLYDNFSPDFPEKMKKLVSKADVITPNLTEASLLLNRKFPETPLSKGFVHTVLEELSSLGPKKVILTGVFFNRYDLGAASYDADTGKVDYFFSKKIPGTYYGTGDIFCSVIVAGIMNGLPLQRSIGIAVDFTQRSIARTRDAGTDPRFGVDFESGIGKMIDDMSLISLSYRV